MWGLVLHREGEGAGPPDGGFRVGAAGRRSSCLTTSICSEEQKVRPQTAPVEMRWETVGLEVSRGWGVLEIGNRSKEWERADKSQDPFIHALTDSPISLCIYYAPATVV